VHKRVVFQKHKNISKEKTQDSSLKIKRSLKHVYFIIIIVILVIYHLIANLEKKIISQMLFRFLKLKIRDPHYLIFSLNHICHIFRGKLVIFFNELYFLLF
jgi:hypothetical protein